jgi:malignant T-cell-amplified sequence
MKRWVLSRRDSADMISKVESSLSLSLTLPKSAQADCAEPVDGVVFVNLDGLTFLQAGESYLPFLGSKEALALFPSATVDQGAIRFILNGADVMRPGIRKLDDWGDVGRLVVVHEEAKGRAIAVCRSTVSGQEAQSMTRGSCLKNLHHVGDKYWTAHKAL